MLVYEAIQLRLQNPNLPRFVPADFYNETQYYLYCFFIYKYLADILAEEADFYEMLITKHSHPGMRTQEQYEKLKEILKETADNVFSNEDDEEKAGNIFAALKKEL
jgi:hypothetical protein